MLIVPIVDVQINNIGLKSAKLNPDVLLTWQYMTILAHHPSEVFLYIVLKRGICFGLDRKAVIIQEKTQKVVNF